MNWHIGCSGFHYKHWKGTFYPEKLAQTKWFSYYCEFFNTLELNATFYRFPRLPSLQSWYQKSPSDFRFAVKASRGITHYKQFIGTTDILNDFYQTVSEGLKDKLGCILFQMPPRFSYSEERLERIIKSLDSSQLNVLEFRHASWWRSDVYSRLGSHNISFCGMSHPSLPDDVISNGPILYYRLHGKEQLYASRYSTEDLKAMLAEVQRNANVSSDAYLFFNNDIHTYAVYNAKEMNELPKSDPEGRATNSIDRFL